MASRLAQLYQGASLTPSSAARIGSTVASTGRGIAQTRRRTLLVRGLQSGAIKESDLGPLDKATLGIPVDPDKVPNKLGEVGFLSGVAGFFGNLGEDVYETGKGFLPGVVQFGKSIGQDLYSQLPGGPEARLMGEKGSHFRKNIIDPVVESYKRTYGQGNVLKNIYEHPLGPILDVATIASLGALGGAKAGSLVARSAAPGSAAQATGLKLAGITDRAGRDPIVIKGLEGQTGEFPRDYSRAPLRKLSQKAEDRIASAVPKLRRVQEAHYTRKWQRDVMNRSESIEATNIERALRGDPEGIDDAVAGLGPLVQHMDEEQNAALILALSGANTAERIATLQNSIRKTLENEHPKGIGMNWNEIQGIWDGDSSYLEYMAALPPRVRELAAAPDDIMVEASERWAEINAKNAEKLGISPEESETHIANQVIRLEEQRLGPVPEPIITYYRQLREDPNPLDETVDEIDEILTEYPQIDQIIRNRDDPSSVPLAPPGHRIRPDYVPHMQPRGYTADSSGVSKGKRTSQTGSATPDRSPKALFTPASTRFQHESTGTAFLSGAFRIDRRALMDHIREVERARSKDVWNQDVLRQSAARDEDGNVMEFKSDREMRGALGEGWTLVAPQFPYQFYRAETNMLEKSLQVINDLESRGITDLDADAIAVLENLQDQHAAAFVRTNWGALRRKGWAIPTRVYDYQVKLAAIHDPYNWAFPNWLARWHHRWRTLTLTYMPRWALNTAVGSFLLSGITGNMRFRDFKLAKELRAKGELPPGVDQRVMSVRDYMEPGMPGQLREGEQAMLGNVGEVKMPTREILRFVQGIEDFFRGPQFVRQLHKEAANQAQVAGETLKSFWQDMDDRPMVEQWLDDPDMVRRALEETNKMSYAYGSLTPFERRYLRTFVPFWGWYKFISKFAWRLPVEMPGRANVINQLATMGQMREDEFGQLPPWIKGSILLNLVGGKLKYISALGANPLSEFMNPLRAGSLFKLSQTTPLAQAGLSALGYDTLRGGEVSISPETDKVGRGIFGDLVDIKSGQPVNMAEHSFWRRFVGGLLRSVPQVRIGEQYLAGGPVYPESIPVLSERPLPRAEGFDRPNFLNDVLGAYGGVTIRDYELTKAQELARKQALYSSQLWKRNLQRVRETNK